MLLQLAQFAEAEPALREAVALQAQVPLLVSGLVALWRALLALRAQ